MDTHADRETDARAVKNIPSDYPEEESEIFWTITLKDCKDMIRHATPALYRTRDRAGVYGEKKLRPAPRTPATDTAVAIPHTSHR